MRGVKLYPHFLSEREIALYRLHCSEALDAIRAVVTSERSRVRRYGYTYGRSNVPPTLTQPLPGWIRDLAREVDVLLRRGDTDAVTLNEYARGGRISPHSDSHYFDDCVGTLSLGACVYTLYDGDPRPPVSGFATIQNDVGKPVETLSVPSGTLLIMRDPVIHACEASGEETRYSIVFRRRGEF